MKNTIQHFNAPSATSSRKSITIKKVLTLNEYKSVVFLLKDYHLAMRTKRDLPKESLPSLSTLIDATLVVDAYLKNINLGISLKLYNACLPIETVVAVWLFANEPTLNVKIGNYQLLALNHGHDRSDL